MFRQRKGLSTIARAYRNGGPTQRNHRRSGSPGYFRHPTPHSSPCRPGRSRRVPIGLQRQPVRQNARTPHARCPHGARPAGYAHRLPLPGNRIRSPPPNHRCAARCRRPSPILADIPALDWPRADSGPGAPESSRPPLWDLRRGPDEVGWQRVRRRVRCPLCRSRSRARHASCPAMPHPPCAASSADSRPSRHRERRVRRIEATAKVLEYASHGGTSRTGTHAHGGMGARRRCGWLRPRRGAPG